MSSNNNALNTNVYQADNAAIQSKVRCELASWETLSKFKSHVLYQFGSELKAILDEAAYDEMYGVKLVAPEEGSAPVHTTLVILQKFLRANEGKLPGAKAQLLAALKWRKTYNPLAAKDEVFSKEKFGGLGYVKKVKGAKLGVQQSLNEQDVVVFNIYGAAAKNSKETFGDTDAFVRWRVALMELTLSHLNLGNATSQIADYGEGLDPYQAIQVHDYQSVSFFRQPAEIKASSSKIIDLFQKYYPETVSYKYFANVPLLMQWMMGAMKAVMSKDSIQKMLWTSYGNTLHQYLGNDVPKDYGGAGQSLESSAWTVKYGDVAAAPTATTVAEPTKTAEPESQPSKVAEPLVQSTATEVAEPSAIEASQPIKPAAPTEGVPEIKKS